MNCPPGVIGGNAVGLSAACAYIAARRAGSTDVPFEVAQQAACLAPKDFQKLVDNVQRYCPTHEIVSEPVSPKKSRLRSKSNRDDADRPEILTYAWLVEQWMLPAMWRPWLIGHMQELEAKFFDSCQRNEGVVEDQIKCVVFFFVVQSVNLTMKSIQDLAYTARISVDELRGRLELFEKACGQYKKQLLAMFTAQGTPRANRHANRTLGTPSKRSVPPSPSKQSLPPTPSKQSLPPTPSKQPLPPTPSKQSIPPTPSKRSVPPSPAKSALKRSADSTPNKPARTVSFPSVIQSSQLDLSEDRDDMVPQTPSKRRKLDLGSPTKSTRLLPTIEETTEVGASPAKRLFSASPSKTPRAPAKPSASPPQRPQIGTKRTASQMEEASAETRPSRRRFRPVFLDRQQWARRDPRVQDAVKVGEERLEKWIEQHGNLFVF